MEEEREEEEEEEESLYEGCCSVVVSSDWSTTVTTTKNTSSSSFFGWQSQRQGKIKLSWTLRRAFSAQLASTTQEMLISEAPCEITSMLTPIVQHNQTLFFKRGKNTIDKVVPAAARAENIFPAIPTRLFIC